MTKQKDLFTLELEKEIEKDRQFTFIQIGANDGVSFDGLYEFVTNNNCDGYVVEPILHYYKLLEKNYLEFDNIIPIHCAIHAEDEKATIHFVDPNNMKGIAKWNNGIGSFFYDHHKKTKTPSDRIISEEVNCRTLMSIIEETKFEKLSLLQIDVEGYDVEVIKSIDFSKIKPSVIKYEHKNIPKKENDVAREILISNNYNLHKIGSDTVAILEKGQ